MFINRLWSVKTKHHTSKIICKKAPTFAITSFSFLSTNTQIITQNTPTLPAIKKATGKKKKNNCDQHSDHYDFSLRMRTCTI